MPEFTVDSLVILEGKVLRVRDQMAAVQLKSGQLIHVPLCALTAPARPQAAQVSEEGSATADGTMPKRNSR